MILQQKNFIIYLENGDDIPKPHIEKGIKKTMKKLFSSRKSDLSDSKPPIADQIEFIQNKINTISNEIETLSEQKQKTIVQYNQLVYSSTYLMKNLFKEL